MIKSAWIVGEQCRLQIGLKGVCIGAQDTLGTDAEVIEVSGDRFDCPFIRFDKTIAANLLESGFPLHLLGSVQAATRYMCRGYAPGGDSAARPFVDDLGYNALPRIPVAGETASSHNGQAVSRLQQSERLFRHGLLIEPVKRIPIVTSSNQAGGAFSSSALPTIHLMWPNPRRAACSFPTSTISGSRSIAQIFRKVPTRAKATRPGPQAKSRSLS
jgi:hypothetical protein